MKNILLLTLISLCISSTYAQKKDNLLFLNFENGQIISSQNATIKGNLSLSSKAYDTNMLGIYFKYNENDIPSNPDGRPVLIKKNNILKEEGIAEVKYNSENGTIRTGDPVTSSNIPGVAMKATEPGMILGVALEDAKNSSGLVKIRILIQYMR